MRFAFVLALTVSTLAAAQPEAPTIKPTPVTLKSDAVLGEVAEKLSKAPAGVAVTIEPRSLKAKCPVAFAGTPFWESLESIADQTKTRIALRDGGRTALLETRPKGREISSVSGPFRVVPRTVVGKLLLEDGTVFHEVQLDVHWEPRMPVYRIDTHPHVAKVSDDRGTALTVADGSSRHYPTGAITEMAVKVTGITRESRSIGTLSGDFRATAAEKMLAVRFANPSEKNVALTESGVKVTLKSFEKAGDTWDAQLALEYPANHPHFDSFEEQRWLRDTRLRLVSPQGKPTDADSEDATASGRFVTATYRFKVAPNFAPKGWSLVCETPGPLMELRVPFELKGIPIP